MFLLISSKESRFQFILKSVETNNSIGLSINIKRPNIFRIQIIDVESIQTIYL